MKSNGLKTEHWCTQLQTHHCMNHNSNLTLCNIIYCLGTNNNPFSYTSNTPAHHSTLRSEYFQDKWKQNKGFHFSPRKSFWRSLTMKIASVVSRPGKKPNCISSMTIYSLMIFSITISTLSALDLWVSSYGNSLCLKHYLHLQRNSRYNCCSFPQELSLL